MRSTHAAFALTMLLVVACGSPGGDAATPRPTYTPYPTLTAETPSGTTARAEAAPQNSDQGQYVEMGGRKEWFFGEDAVHVQNGIDEFRRGNYRAAVRSFQETRQHRDKPSAAVESWLGLSYQALQRYEDAIRHHSASIEIEESVGEYTNRGIAYLYLGQCGLAVTDAKVALTMEPESTESLHTDAEANYILGSCYAYDGQYLLALQHSEAALEISIRNDYARELISDRELLVEQIREGLGPNRSDIDFFLGSALTAWEQGIEWFNEGEYRNAIESFESALEHHGKPSSVLESWLGLSFQSLGQHSAAITHFTRAIEIRDSAVDRLNRSGSYMETAQCPRAVEDAQEALSMPLYEEDEYHSKVEANSVLAACYLVAGDYRSAYVHAESALSGAIAHGYPTGDVDSLIEVRDLAKSLADAKR